MTLGPQFGDGKKRLFEDQFHSRHGMTVDQALQGYARPVGGGEIFDPERMEEFSQRLQPGGRPWSETVHSIVSERRPISEVVGKWMMNSDEFLIGHPTEVARDVVHFDEEMRNNAVTPQTRLYRGARISPEEQVRARPDSPISFTEDRHVATSFSRRDGERGSIFKVDPDSGVRGLHVPDYVTRQRTVGRNSRPEREWILDPTSLPGV